MTDLERNKSLLKTINDFAIELLNIPTRTELVWYVAREVVGRLGFDDCVIYLMNPAQNRLRQVAAIGIKNPHGDQIVNALEIPIGKGVTGDVARLKRPIIVGDLSADGRYIPDLEPALSEICVPLIIDEKVVGVIDCEDPRPWHFGPEHLETLTTIAAMTSAKLKLIGEARRAEARAEALSRLNEQHLKEIVERKEAEDKLRESEERFRDFASTGSDWFWELDSDFRFTLNTASQSLSELNLDNVLGKTRWELPGIDPEDEIWRQHRADLEAHKPIRNFKYSLLGKNGEIRYSRINGKPMYDSEGNFVGYRGTTSNITDLHFVEEKYRQAQKMEAVGQLTGGVAHDFNNLLAAILGHAEIMEERLGENNKSVRTIVRAATRGAELTQRLLAFSRRQSLDPRPTDIGDLIRDVHQLLQRTLGETIDIEIAPAPSLWHAMTDPGQLENALLNLAINARHAMPDGGKLIIEGANVSLSADDAASHLEVTPGDYVSLSVRDTGVGMPPDVMEHAFEPFFTTKDVGEGSGLGLSMVYGFAKQSAGDVTIESVPGHGTAITLFLPRAKEALEQATTHDMASAPRGRGETVLLIEDDPDVRDMTGAMLEILGYRVLPAENARAGLAILEAEPAIDLMLSDVVLPGGMSGPGLAEQVRTVRPGIRVLFMSGYTEKSNHHQTPLPEGSDLLNKPFRQFELAERVRAVLDR